jgi:hypothetical protein
MRPTAHWSLFVNGQGDNLNLMVDEGRRQLDSDLAPSDLKNLSLYLHDGLLQTS